MTDFARARRMMVDGQIRTNDVTDLRLLAAFDEVPRERFLPASKQPLAYLDLDVPLVDAPVRRALLKPMVLARLVHAAEIGEADSVLDVGCASGYLSAVLARLAASVVALEEDAGLAKLAAEALAASGAANVRVVTGSLAAGWEADAPYDVIVLEGSAELVPDGLLQQLKEGGRLVGVIGPPPIGKAMVYRRSGSHAGYHPVFDAVAPLLPGFAKPKQFVF